MKGLALETVVQWIILLVVATVVISLVLYFSDEIKMYVESWMNPGEGPKAEIIESSQFSTSQVKTYMRACWDRTGERFKKDVVCYILKGDVSGVNADDLKNAVETPASIDTSKFEQLKNVTIIKFEDVGNKIIVES
jgi:hypothetical protein